MKMWNEYDVEKVVVEKKVPYVNVRLTVKEAESLRRVLTDVRAKEGSPGSYSDYFKAYAFRRSLQTQLDVINGVGEEVEEALGSATKRKVEGLFNQ